MIRKHTSTARRSGIILLVVMSLLALFAALGLTFVYLRRFGVRRGRDR